MNEQTLLPDGVELAGVINEKGLADLLTSIAFRVTYSSANIKEVLNANRKQKPETGNKARRTISQAELLMRGGRGRGRQAPLSLSGRTRFQKPLRGRLRSHRACMRRVGLLELGGCHPYASAYRDQGCRGQGRHCRRGTRPGQEANLPPSQSAWRPSRSGSLVLLRLQQELHGCRRRNAAGLPSRSSGQLTQTDNRIANNQQAPLSGGLPRYPVQQITIPPRLAKVMFGNHPERGSVLFGNHADYQALTSRGDI